MKQTLMGNDAIALGLIHANVDMVSGYPGTPSSEILTGVQKIKKELKEKYVKRGMVQKIIAAWIITVPAAATFSAGVFFMIKGIMS